MCRTKCHHISSSFLLCQCVDLNGGVVNVNPFVTDSWVQIDFRFILKSVCYQTFHKVLIIKTNWGSKGVSELQMQAIFQKARLCFTPHSSLLTNRYLTKSMKQINGDQHCEWNAFEVSHCPITFRFIWEIYPFFLVMKLEEEVANCNSDCMLTWLACIHHRGHPFFRHTFFILPLSSASNWYVIWERAVYWLLWGLKR